MQKRDQDGQGRNTVAGVEFLNNYEGYGNALECATEQEHENVLHLAVAYLLR